MTFIKEISLGNILTLVGMIAVVVVGYAKIQTRLTLVEATNGMRAQQTAEIRQDMRDLRQDIKTIATILVKESNQREAEAATKK